jgi:hypothetical protein
MRVKWHTLAQTACFVLGCGSSEEPAVDPVRHDCPVFNSSVPGSSGSHERVKTDPLVRETYRGKNGEFTDECLGGNLVQYACESSSMVGPPGDPTVWVSASGEVESLLYACDGRCVNGACPNVCPAVSDKLRYLFAGTSARLESLDTGISYTCVLRAAASGVDCMTTPQPGDVVNVISTGSFCVDSVEFWTGTGAAPECDYWNCKAVVP